MDPARLLSYLLIGAVIGLFYLWLANKPLRFGSWNAIYFLFGLVVYFFIKVAGLRFEIGLALLFVFGIVASLWRRSRPQPS